MGAMSYGGALGKSHCARRFFIMAVGAVIGIFVTASGAFAMNAKQFQDEFQKNEEAFKQKYIGKPVTVTGTVSIISLSPARGGPGIGPAVGLMDIDKGEWGVIYCYLNDTDKARGLSLSKGQRITVTGIFLRANVAGLHIDPCSFQ
jgi:hypothetical protein